MSVPDLKKLTPEQQSTLDQFRSDLKTEGLFVEGRHDEHTLLRFLRARKYDLPKTKLMFCNAEAWRKSFGVEELVKDFKFDELAEVQKIYPRYYHKTDKAGRPLYIEQLGKLDLKALLKITDEDRLTKYHVVSYERFLNVLCPACTKAIGRDVCQSFTILDLKGVSLRQFASAFGFVKRTISIAQDYYPETLGMMFVINAPLLFTSTWGMIKPLLDPVTISKIKIIGSGYQKELLSFVDAENLPAEFGGTCNCPGGCSLSDEGPWKHAKA